MITNYIKNSVLKFFKDKIPNIYIYNDSNIDISKQVKCRSFTDLSPTDVTFILYDIDYNVALTDNDLVNWYLRFTDNGIDKYRRITAYDSLTGTITINSGFGINMLTTDQLVLTCLDSIYITNNDLGSLNNSRRYNVFEYTRVRFSLQTKNDSNTERLNDFIDVIKEEFYSKYRKIEIYNNSNVLLGFLRIKENVNFTPKIDADNNLQSYIGTFLLEHNLKYS